MYQQGQYQAALAQFQQAVNTQPNNADSYYNLASTMHRLGTQQKDQKLLQQAETLYNQCLDLDQNHPDCHRALAVLLVETNRTDKAFTLTKNWVAANPRSAESRIELARLYEEFGDRDSATTYLQQALAIEQNNPRAWAALGKLREEAGDIPQALANYQRSLTLNRAQPGVSERVAQLQRQAGGPYGINPNGTRTVVRPPVTAPVAQPRY
jgi:tetratricopeptide (TPR) repeat protein